MKAQLLTALLERQFYDDNAPFVDPSTFEDDSQYRSLYRTLKRYRDNGNEENLTPEQLNELYLAYYPTANQADKFAIKATTEIMAANPVNRDMARELIALSHQRMVKEDLAKRLLEGIDDPDFDSSSFLDASQKLVKTGAGKGITALFPKADTSLLALTSQAEAMFKWAFWPPQIAERLPGCGDGMFILVAARPNAGKTAFVVGSVFYPDRGFAYQGAKVVILGNEESVGRTINRCYSCVFSKPKEYFINLKDEEKKPYDTKFKEMFPNVEFYQAQGMTLSQMEMLISEIKPDILIVDQLDKIRVGKDDTPAHERLQKLYSSTRDLTVKYNMCIIGVSQASESAEGRKIFGAECLENSRTGKFAEMDVIITIGKENGGQDNGQRYLNFAKNKPTGKEDRGVFVKLNREFTRLESA